MNSPQRKIVPKTLLVISDLHLGAGHIIGGKRNFLEEFHFDQELIEFLEFYSSGEYIFSEVEIIINGDFFDLLAVPFVKYFDDEFWSEKAALEKFKIILNAHKDVIDAMIRFISKPSKTIIYIIGNHDAELIFPSLQEHFLSLIPQKIRHNFSFFLEEEYEPFPQIVIKHGHDYEKAHAYDRKNAIVKSIDNENYFDAPWGSYYVTRIINKFKEQRNYIDSVRPIRAMLLNGLIYDSLFTLRFMFANSFYFIMVRFLALFSGKSSIIEVMKMALKELELFDDYEYLTRDFFKMRPDAKVLIMGHTHYPMFKSFSENKIFINTGTWTRMIHMDFSNKHIGFKLTFAKVNILKKNETMLQEERRSTKVFYDAGVENEFYFETSLNIWRGNSTLPYTNYY